MKMKFGAIVIDGRGKIGGHVASKNRAGAYLRTKVTPVNPQSVDQNTVRNRFTGFSQGWRGLTEAQRDAWNAAVGDYAKTDIFGDLKNPTGFNLYQRLNNNLSQCGVAAITTPPVPAAVENVIASALAIDSALGTYSLTLSAAVPANTYVKLLATAPQSAGKNFVKSEYRQIDILDPAALAAVDIETAYVAKFGEISNAGQKVFVKLIPVNGTTGQTGTASAIDCIVT